MPRAGYREAIKWAHAVAIKHTGEECLIWPFYTMTNGYAGVRVNGRLSTASRYICRLVHGDPEDERLYAAHSCGKGRSGCVNPSHLRWATPLENTKDKLLHGTSSFGERNPMAKLTAEDVAQIRLMRAHASAVQIAQKFSLHPQTVRQIVSGRRWPNSNERGVPSNGN